MGGGCTVSRIILDGFREFLFSSLRSAKKNPQKTDRCNDNKRLLRGGRHGKKEEEEEGEERLGIYSLIISESMRIFIFFFLFLCELGFFQMLCVRVRIFYTCG